MPSREVALFVAETLLPVEEFVGVVIEQEILFDVWTIEAVDHFVQRLNPRPYIFNLTLLVLFCFLM